MIDGVFNNRFRDGGFNPPASKNIKDPEKGIKFSPEFDYELEEMDPENSNLYRLENRFSGKDLKTFPLDEECRSRTSRARIYDLSKLTPSDN